MSGEQNLDRLLATMQPVLTPDTYVFATTRDPAKARLPARMRLDEAEGTTLILTEAEARAAGLDGVFPARMITLNVHSALDAVGFLARITTRLAAAGMGVNPVSGFYHDHLFVPADRAAEAMEILRDLAAEGRA